MITKWLKDRTPEEREAHLKEQIGFPLETLRKHQDIVNAQKRKAFELYNNDKTSQWKHKRDNADAKWDPIFENLEIQDNDLMEAIGRKCFGDNCFDEVSA